MNYLSFMQRALVTEGASFIGLRVTRALLRAWFRVRIPDDLSPQIRGAVPGGLDWLSADGIAGRLS